MLQKCFVEIFSSLPADAPGFWVNLNKNKPDQPPEMRFIAVYMVNHVADDSERRDINGYGGHGSAYPCMACDVAHEDLGSLENHATPRSAALVVRTEGEGNVPF